MALITQANPASSTFLFRGDGTWQHPCSVMALHNSEVQSPRSHEGDQKIWSSQECLTTSNPHYKELPSGLSGDNPWTRSSPGTGVAESEDVEAIQDAAAGLKQEGCSADALGASSHTVDVGSGHAQQMPCSAGPRSQHSGLGGLHDLQCPPHGLVSVCGRRREMEDAVAAVPAFLTVPGTSTTYLELIPDSSLDANIGDAEGRAGASSPLHFFGVYDGHGGSQAAAYCADRLHHTLAEEVQAVLAREGQEDASSGFPSVSSGGDPGSAGSMGSGVDNDHLKEALNLAFLRLDAEVGGKPTSEPADWSRSPAATTSDISLPETGVCSLEGTASPPSSSIPDVPPADPIAPETVGSTAVVAVVGGGRIVVANCGDSRAVLSRGGQAVALSVDHKPEREDEMARVEAAGGRVIFWNGYRVLGVLAMSRAIGDRYLKPYVIAQPEVTCTDRSEEDECLILASDGLWDVIGNKEACDIARRCLTSQPRSSSSNGDEADAQAAGCKGGATACTVPKADFQAKERGDESRERCERSGGGSPQIGTSRRSGSHVGTGEQQGGLHSLQQGGDEGERRRGGGTQAPGRQPTQHFCPSEHAEQHGVDGTQWQGTGKAGRSAGAVDGCSVGTVDSFDCVKAPSGSSPGSGGGRARPGGSAGKEKGGRLSEGGRRRRSTDSSGRSRAGKGDMSNKGLDACLSSFVGSATGLTIRAGPRPEDEQGPAAVAAAVLVKMALARGSGDNISVVVVDLQARRHTSDGPESGAIAAGGPQAAADLSGVVLGAMDKHQGEGPLSSQGKRGAEGEEPALR